MAKKVLLIEDNRKNRLLERDVLAYHGYETLEAHNGELGIRMARERSPDLILLDMQLPEMDGFTVARILKADPQTRDIKIIAVTSLAMKGDRERILAIGVDDYLAKPIDTRELPERVRRILE